MIITEIMRGPRCPCWTAPCSTHSRRSRGRCAEATRPSAASSWCDAMGQGGGSALGLGYVPSPMSAEMTDGMLKDPRTQRSSEQSLLPCSRMAGVDNTLNVIS